MQYCNSLTIYSRFKTRVVKVGDLTIGGDPSSEDFFSYEDDWDDFDFNDYDGYEYDDGYDLDDGYY